MKKHLLLLFISTSLLSCKKDKKPSLLGTWLSGDKGTQFTIDNLHGKGKIYFKLDGDILTWKFADITTVYRVIHVYESTMTLNENGKDIQFMRLR